MINTMPEHWMPGGPVDKDAQAKQDAVDHKTRTIEETKRRAEFFLLVAAGIDPFRCPLCDARVLVAGSECRDCRRDGERDPEERA